MTPKERVQLSRDRLFIATNLFYSCKTDLVIANKMKSNKRKSMAMTGINLSRNNLRRCVRLLEGSIKEYKQAERDFLNGVMAA